MARQKADDKGSKGQIININARDDDEEQQLDAGAGFGQESGDDHDFDSFVAELAVDQGTVYESKVYRQPQGHGRENEFLFAFRPGEITFTGLQLKVRAEYGPGRYFCRTYVSGIDAATQRPYTQLVKGGTFKFAIGATLGGPVAAGGPNPFAIAGGDPASMKLLERLFNEKARPVTGVDPVMAMVMENQRESSKLMMTVMLGMMGLMQNRQPVQNGDPIDQAAKLLRLSRELNGDVAEDDTLGRVLGAAEKVLPSLFNAIGATYGTGAKPRQATIPLGHDQGEAIDPRLLAALQSQAEGISKLPQAFAFGIDDEALIDAMLDPIETDEQLDALKAVANHPQVVQALIGVVPALGEHAARLATFIDALRAALPGVELEDDAGDHPLGNAVEGG